jgi:hypothetical protein
MANAESHTTTGDNLLRALRCFSALPAAFLVSLGSLVLYARARLNSWPVAHTNDPKDIGVSHVIFYLLTLGLFLGSLVTVLFMPQRHSGVRSPRSAVPWSILALVLWALLILIVKWDPGGYIEWIFD